MSAELPSQFSHDVKIEETAQGIRIHVHVYGTEAPKLIIETFDLYQACTLEADKRKILRAPMEIKEVKKK